MQHTVSLWVDAPLWLDFCIHAAAFCSIVLTHLGHRTSAVALGEKCRDHLHCLHASFTANLCRRCKFIGFNLFASTKVHSNPSDSCCEPTSRETRNDDHRETPETAEKYQTLVHTSVAIRVQRLGTTHRVTSVARAQPEAVKRSGCLWRHRVHLCSHFSLSVMRRKGQLLLRFNLMWGHVQSVQSQQVSRLSKWLFGHRTGCFAFFLWEQRVFFFKEV